jgi:hypothetical protein
MNASATCWAILFYIGIGHMLVDIWIGLTKWLYVTTYPKQPAPATVSEPALDWQFVLYRGHSRSMAPVGVIGNQLASSIHTAEERQLTH